MKIKGKILDERDFEGMRFNPLLPAKKKKKTLEYYPQLRSIDDITFLKPHEIDFVLTLYSQDTPMFRISDYSERKSLAADMCTDEPRQKERLLKLGGKILYVVDKYLRLQNNKLVSTIISNEEYFYELQSLMLTEIEAEKSKDLVMAMEKKGKVLAQMDDISARLEGYYYKLYGDHEEVRVNINDQLIYTPEGVAKALTELDNA